MTDKKKTNSSKSVEVKKDLGLAASTRRDAVKNILAGSTLAAGAATSSVWVKPVVDAVVTPAHAQTSTPTSTIQPTTTFFNTTTAAPTTTSFSTTTAAPTTTSFSTTTAAPTSTPPTTLT
jgi:hypothetical protein